MMPLFITAVLLREEERQRMGACVDCRMEE